jgi:predicted  nucleic acid-binding Zn-ribbon protein
MTQLLLLPFLLGLILTISACDKRDERILPKLGSADQVDVKGKSALEREEFIRQAQQEVDELRVKLSDIKARAIAATGQAKAKLDQQVLALEQEQRVVEEKLANLKTEIGEKWKELKTGVTAAIEQFKQSLKNSI